MEGLNGIAYSVNGLAMQVHRKLGPGLDELFYHQLLSERMNQAGIAHQFKPSGKLIHRGYLADEFEPDILIPGLLIPECKAIRGEFANEHFGQLISYQKFWRVQTGLLLNFRRQSLVFRCVVYDEKTVEPLDTTDLIQSVSGSDRSLIGQLCDAISRIHSEYGLGYREKSYRGLVLAELSAEKVPWIAEPAVDIPFKAGSRTAHFDCIVVDGRSALMVQALKDEVTASDRAVLQTYLGYLELAWGLAINFGKRCLVIRIVTPPHRGK